MLFYSAVPDGRSRIILSVRDVLNVGLRSATRRTARKFLAKAGLSGIVTSR